jgi:hypothetical protein
MNNHNHCWHDAYTPRRVDGQMRQLEACCQCGATREMHLRAVTPKYGKHGPFVPVRETAGTVPAGLAVNGG